ncbi:DUF3048 domain-containing protein [Paenibacillus sp. TRM 82003]|nr:DUF3048 domain-containing protein [Paenibacillus sp. TRM 82003]
MERKPSARGVMACLLGFALLAGCSGGASVEEPIVEPEPVVEPALTTEVEPEPEPLPYVYPLTGVPTEEAVTNRPVVVMVENSPAARPQTGLHEADFVYEVLAEGDITRFIAIYQSVESEEIGPVRSIRPYFVELGRAVDGILVHAGWSQEAMNLMVKHKLNHLDQVYGDHDFYWRDKSRKAPHNLYTSIELIEKGAEARKFRAEWTDPVLTFVREGQTGGERASSGETAEQVTIPYLLNYSVGYTYDEAAGAYLRTMKDEPHNDKKSGTRLTATNVLIVEAPHRIVDNVGRREVDVFGPGPGYLLQEGKKQEITWQLKNGVIRAYAKEGDAVDLPLLPGKSWVQIVPNLSKVTFGDED